MNLVYVKYLLQVFRLEDQLCLFTLHGHKAAVTALHLDKVCTFKNFGVSEQVGSRFSQ